jgi:ribonuclease III
VPPDAGQHIARLESRIGHRFARRELLELALTHRSYGAGNNERLEFLGDALLNLGIAAELYARYPRLREGQLHRLRVSLVRGETLAEIGRELELGPMLRLGAGEAASGGRERDSILADAVEALLGAVCLDAGTEAALGTVRACYAERLAGLEPGISHKDAKTELQEYLQARHAPLPHYELAAESGSAAEPRFRVRCRVRELAEPVEAEGRTKRAAEQQAAREALRRLIGAEQHA